MRSDDASETSWRSQGIDICDEALLSRDGSRFEGWTELGAKRAQLPGWLAPTQTQRCHEGPQPARLCNSRSPGAWNRFDAGCVS